MMTEETRTLPFDPPSVIDRAAVAADLGVERVRVLKPDWSQLMGEMVHVRMSVKFWRAQERITLEDLGLEDAPEDFRDVARRRMALGHHTLCPKELLAKLHSLEQTARNICGRCGVKSPWDGYLIYKRQWQEWKSQIDALQPEFYRVADQVTNSREQWLEETVQDYWQLAMAADLKPASVAAYMARIRDAIPSAEVIRSRFLMDYDVSIVEAPKLSQEADIERLAAQKGRLDAQLEEIKERIRENSRNLHSNEEWQASQARLQAERDRLNTETEILKCAQEKAASIKVKQFEEVCGDAAARVWDTLGACAFGVLKSLKLKEGTAARVYPAQVAAIRQLVADIRTWNIMGDTRLDAIAAEAEVLLPDDPKGGTVDKDAALSLMEDAAAIWKLVCADMTRPVRVGGTLTDAEEALLHAPLTERQARHAIERFDPESLDAMTVSTGRTERIL